MRAADGDDEQPPALSATAAAMIKPMGKEPGRAAPHALAAEHHCINAPPRRRRLLVDEAAGRALREVVAGIAGAVHRTADQR
jgi:hypothetical protein